MGEELPEKLLVLLDGLSVVDSQTLSQKFGQDHQRIVGAIKSLEALGQYNQWYNTYVLYSIHSIFFLNGILERQDYIVLF